MPQATIRFKHCLQDSQDLGTEEHMVARVGFDLEVDGHVLEDLTVNIKQPVGDVYATAPIEVVKPEGYSGPLDYDAFRRAVESYYRGLVGSGGGAIHMAPGSSVRMRNNLIISPKTVRIDHPEGAGGW